MKKFMLAAILGMAVLVTQNHTAAAATRLPSSVDCTEHAIPWSAYSVDQTDQAGLVNEVRDALAKVSKATGGKYTFRFVAGTQAWHDVPSGVSRESLEQAGDYYFPSEVQLMFVLAASAGKSLTAHDISAKTPWSSLLHSAGVPAADGQLTFVNVSGFAVINAEYWHGRDLQIPSWISKRDRRQILADGKETWALGAAVASLGISWPTNKSASTVLPQKVVADLNSETKWECTPTYEVAQSPTSETGLTDPGSGEVSE